MIVWRDLDGVDEIFAILVDGVHCRINEPKHPTHSKNPKFYSHKFRQSALCYELAVSVHHNALVWMNGPFKAGQIDLVIFCEGLIALIPDGKKVTEDNGYCGD